MYCEANYDRDANIFEFVVVPFNIYLFLIFVDFNLVEGISEEQYLNSINSFGFHSLFLRVDSYLFI